MNNFAVTIKKTRKPVTKQHYLDYLNYCTDLGEVANVNFEETRGMHVHFIIRCKKLDYKKLTLTKRGWNAKVVPVYNLAGWTKYCRKDHLTTKELNSDLPFLTISQEEDPLTPRMQKLLSQNIFRCCNNNEVKI